MVDQVLVYLCNEKTVEIMDRISRIMIALSKGVFIHFHSQERLFSNKNAVRAIRVTMWITLIAQPWTAPIARGVKMSNK
jgi:hypothetical protein